MSLCLRSTDTRLNCLSACRSFKGSASYVKSCLRKGQALLGLGCTREAAASLDAGLKLDPFNLDLKQALQQANQAMLKVGHWRRGYCTCWWYCLPAGEAARAAVRQMPVDRLHLLRQPLAQQL